MWNKAVAVLPAVATLAGCMAPADAVAYQANTQYVAISDIVGTIKCALALTLRSEALSGDPRLTGGVAALNFTFKVVDKSSYGGSVDAKAAGPFVFAFGGPASILPRAGASLARENTVTTEIHSRLGLRYVDTKACAGLSSRQREKAGFESRLSYLLTQLDVQADKSPYGIVDRIVFKSDFGVVRKGNVGTAIDFVFLGSDLNASAERNDVQSMEMTIQSPSKETPYPEVYMVEDRPPLKPGRSNPASSPPMKSSPAQSKAVVNVQEPKQGTAAPAAEAEKLKCRPKGPGLGCLDVPPVQSDR